MKSASNFQLKMQGKENIFLANGVDHVLKSMAKGGVDIAPNGCHGGGCGVCKIKILSGSYEPLSMSKKYVSQEEREQGFVLACRVIPKSDLEFEFVGKPQCKRVSEKKKYGFV